MSSTTGVRHNDAAIPKFPFGALAKLFGAFLTVLIPFALAFISGRDVSHHQYGDAVGAALFIFVYIGFEIVHAIDKRAVR